MDLQLLMPWLVAANTIIALATALYAGLTSGAKQTAAALVTHKAETAESLEELEREIRLSGEATVSRFNLQEMKIGIMEETLKHLPDRDQAHRLELAIEKLTGRMEAMDERVAGQMKTLDASLKPVSAIGLRLQEFLLEQAKR